MKKETVVFAGGCFWCTEAIFKHIKGIISAVPGYSGGTVVHPSYKQVSSGKTGHAEAVKIEYDADIISFGDLLAVFFNTHDPTTINMQGNDVGEQYRSVIFYTTDAQRKAAVSLIAELDAKKAYDKPVVTGVKPLDAFYDAEDYHRNYYERHKNDAYCAIIIAPKLEKLEKRFSEILSETNLQKHE